MTDLIIVIDRVQYLPKDGRKDLDINETLNNAIRQDIRNAQKWATWMNKEGHKIWITVTGNSKSGVKFRVDCEDEETRQRVSKFINHKLEAQDKDFFDI
ncbi:hypothetical protein [Larkinella terrae]|uniref:Uncharacterized protein n=1 Tax=Larkinella terrae TaxID=2025311 RepID=A0A7K0EHK9_9BACT|nr:hypothetical protein [Larkinella terrae]MRS61235.1 hypothetical protein [Larkinella terrae]